MDITLFSRVYSVRRLSETDVPDILALCGKNRMYYRYCPPIVSEQSIRDDMNALPTGKEVADKYYVGYYDGGKLIAVLDLILAYPDKETAFIGFFMMDVSVQGKGIGSGIIGELCAYLAGNGFARVRLGWVRGNPQAEHFWHKNGFAETGAVYKTERYAVIAAQREL